MKNHGTPPADIARAVHLSVVDRLVGMLHRVGVTGEIVFSGGVARNPAIARFVGEKLEIQIRIPPQPDIVGALGAALSQFQQHRHSRPTLRIQAQAAHNLCRKR